MKFTKTNEDDFYPPIDATPIPREDFYNWVRRAANMAPLNDGSDLPGGGELPPPRGYRYDNPDPPPPADVDYKSQSITERARATDDLSKGGVRLDQGKLKWSLLPWDALREVVKVLMYGASKYKERNWESGMDWSRNFDASMRHKVAWWQDGEDSARDSQILHLAHEVCDNLFNLAYVLRNKGTDDRPKPTLENKDEENCS